MGRQNPELQTEPQRFQPRLEDGGEGIGCAACMAQLFAGGVPKIPPLGEHMGGKEGGGDACLPPACRLP